MRRAKAEPINPYAEAPEPRARPIASLEHPSACNFVVLIALPIECTDRKRAAATDVGSVGYLSRVLILVLRPGQLVRIFPQGDRILLVAPFSSTQIRPTTGLHFLRVARAFRGVSVK